jgi:hypothetical protein
MYEELITTGAWWDYVDELASNRIGPLLAAYPAPMKKAMRAWSEPDDLWKARTSIICQLGFKAETDVALLFRARVTAALLSRPDQRLPHRHSWPSLASRRHFTECSQRLRSRSRPA